jgi:RNA polymerase sigma factor (sigma-70 family)
MRQNIEFKHFEVTERIRGLIEKWIARLGKKIEDFSEDLSEDAVFLRILIEGNPERSLYHLSITLDLPGRMLTTQEERHKVDQTVQEAFAEIERQLEKYRTNLRSERLWKRIARREKVRREKTRPGPPEERDRDRFVGMVEQHLPKLHRFTRREMAYYHATGDLIPGDPTVEDAVDAVVLRAYDEFVKKPSSLDIDRWLLKLAIEHIESEVERTKGEHDKLVPIEEDIPETPPTEEVSTLGDEILDFYEPDENLKLEDVIPDFEVATPEEAAENREVQRHVRRSLSLLPKEWRRAFVLRYVEGLSVAEVAKVTGLAESEVTRRLDYAREYLRAKLVEVGLAGVSAKQ